MDYFIVDKPVKLDKPLKVRGQWWAHDTPERKISGVLRFSTDAIRLELDDLLTVMSSEEIIHECFVEQTVGEYPCVHGRSNDGTPFTLLKVLPGRPGFNNGHPSKSHSLAQNLFVGGHIAPHDVRVRRLDLGFRGLEEFADFHPIQMRPISDHEDQFWAVYVPPEEVLINIDAIGATVSVGTVLSQSSGRAKARVSARTEIKVVGDMPKSLDWCSTTINRLSQWFTLIFNRPVSPSYVLLDTADQPMCWWLYATRWQSKLPMEIPLFKLSDLKAKLPSMHNAWFSATGSLLSAINLFVDERGGQYTYEGRLLVLTQAVEAFCRATIPFEHTQRGRLTTLIQSLQPQTVSMFCRNPDDFVAGVVQTRNYFTHYADDLRAGALDQLDLYWACEKLSWLLHICLLKWLGLDEEIVAKRFGLLLGWKMAGAKQSLERVP